jgi:hypothetical protein
MKQFGIWIGKDLPNISAIKNVYPDFFVMDGTECPFKKSKDARFDSDAIRIWCMATQWLNDDAMYIDCNDMEPIGGKPFTGDGITKPMYWSASGRPDLNFIYRPVGMQSHFINLLNHYTTKVHFKLDRAKFDPVKYVGWAQSYLSISLLHEIDYISGEYFIHHADSLNSSKKAVDA